IYLYAMLRIKPSASHMLGKCSTTELQPQPLDFIFIDSVRFNFFPMDEHLFRHHFFKNSILLPLKFVTPFVKSVECTCAGLLLISLDLYLSLPRDPTVSIYCIHPIF
ncbi:hypothetical protein H1C71_030925, partial [Ictidomys tridecemlineatus]